MASWIVAGGVDVAWSLRLDTLSGVMIVVVTVVSSMVHVYSIGYMHGDPSIPRFMAYLSLFTFFMLALVTSDNFVQLFFGWEGVGLMSYLLVGFWYDRPSANAAAIKAFLVNRVGDFGFSLGIFAVFVIFGSLDFGTVFGAAPKAVGTTMEFLGWQVDSLTLACILLFIGAMGKSAQIPLHTWLPDAMEGPTPVSALIHAATMVTAGVFMVARLSPLFEYAPTALAVVGIIGGTTAIFAASIGMVQPDIKRVVACSTCSQLGYMFAAAGGIGLRRCNVPPVHPCVLQRAVVPVLRIGHPRDGRRAGHAPDGWPLAQDPDDLCDDVGRRPVSERDPVTSPAITQRTRSLKPLGPRAPLSAAMPWCSAHVAAFMTAFYISRVMFMTFHGEPRADEETMHHAHESPWVMRIPLIVLRHRGRFLRVSRL